MESGCRERARSRATLACAAACAARAARRSLTASPSSALSISTRGAPAVTVAPGRTNKRRTRPGMRAPTWATRSLSNSTEPTSSRAGRRGVEATRWVSMPARAAASAESCTVSGSAVSW
ncbi:MAG: hypothetical protein R3A52_28315 [Polyangiales bacterium]